MLTFLFIISMCLTIVYLFNNRKNGKFYNLEKHFKQDVIRSYPILGVSYIFFGNNETRMKAIQRLGELVNDNGGIAGGWFGLRYYIVVSDAKIADIIMKSCLDKDPMMDTLKYVFGNGNVVAPVPLWKPRRKLLMPAFVPSKLNEYIPIFIKSTEILADKLRTKVGTGAFPLWFYLTACNLDSVCESVLGIKLGSQNNPDMPFLKANTEGSKLLGERICQPWLHNDIIFKILPRFKKLKEYKKIIYDFLREVIENKRNNLQFESSGVVGENEMKTFLEQLIKSSTYSDEELLEECLTLVLAGIDTTSITTGFTLLMLAQHPDIQNKVYEELKQVFGEKQMIPEDLRKLKYLEAVIKETSRLYPAFATLLRRVNKDITLPSGLTVVEGCGVMINTWAIHRNKAYWGDDAELFKPERFLDATLKHPAQFMPFSYGPRNCPGYQYAMLNLKTTLATLLRQFSVLPATGPEKPLKLSFDVMMKDADDFLIRLEKRV